MGPMRGAVAALDEDTKKELTKAAIVAAATAITTALAGAGVDALKRLARPWFDRHFPKREDAASGIDHRRGEP